MLPLLDELREISGYVLVQGDWFIETLDNSYKFTRAFVDNVTDSPMCEVSLNKNDIPDSDHCNRGDFFSILFFSILLFSILLFFVLFGSNKRSLRK